MLMLEAPAPATSFSVLFRLAAPFPTPLAPPSFAVPPVLSDHYRVISAADFRVASSHTHSRTRYDDFSFNLFGARHSARIPSSIPPGDKGSAAALFFLFLYLEPPGTR